MNTSASTREERPVATDFVHAQMHERPWMSLPYLMFVFVPLLFWGGAPLRTWVLSLASVAVFVPIYLAAFRLPRGRREWVILAAALLGFAVIPVNIGGYTYIIYAMALSGGLLPARWAILCAAVALLLMAAEILWLVPDTRYGLAMIAISAVIGTMVVSGTLYARVQARRNAELRLSQEEVRRLARVAERERIGRDLHDLLGHTLSLVALKTELAARLIDRDPEAARLQVREVEQVARQALAQVREAVTGIRAASLQAEIASARLALLHAEIDLVQDIPPLPIRADVEAALALALREAVTNVIRHAAATRVEVGLAERGGALNLVVADDGRGGLEQEGNGLCGMRERLHAVGGEIHVDSRPGVGTRLEIRLPTGWRGDAMCQPGEAAA